MASVPAIHGLCDPRFEPVRDALARNFREHRELGAAVALAEDGRFVVDLWAGWADAARTRPWKADTLVNVFSVGKPMAALSLLRWVERGALDLDEPIARHWPEFAAAGKGLVTARMLLGHRAGLPALRTASPDAALYDGKLLTEALALEAPWWEPGALHGYHVNTFGFLVGELVRRVSGRSIGAVFRDEIAGPLAADFHFGIGREHDPRVAGYVFAPDLVAGEARENAGADEGRRFLLQRVYANPPGVSGLGTVNTRAWRAAEMPSTNGHANARAVARIYSAVARGGSLDAVRLLSEPMLEEATREASAGEDFVLCRPSRFGLGFQLTQAGRSFGPGPKSFGHFGVGGSLGFADPERRLAFGYAMNQGGPRWQNPRVRGLIDAVYASG